tara:strand:+ start:10830 stop:11822 length:993 start_codon:yes stop_codon:yes gene_type:complete
MANAAFSPKNFRVAVRAESTNGTDAGIGSSISYLDVDSIGFPTLNVTQGLDIKTGVGRLFKEVDFFQDNKSNSSEFTISGTLHNDTGHKLLLQNIMNSTADPLAIIAAHQPNSGIYGTSTHANTTFTTYIISQDQADGNNIVMEGCMCTNFAINADMGTDGGKYTYSATVSTGRVVHLNNTTSPATGAYSGAPITMAGLTSGSISVYSVNPVLSSFGVTIDSPAVYTGVDSNGYKAFGRGAETAVTATATVKLDSVTRDLPQTFYTQASQTADDAGCLTLTQGTASDFSISIPRGVMTSCAYNEGDIMMLDVEMKAAVSGSDDLLTIDVE